MASAKRPKRASLSRLLESAEERRSKLEALRGTKEGAQLKAEHDWDAAMRRATGEKVRDDPKLLRRTLKREERKKKKSSKVWGDRKKQEQEERASRQNKREENLQRRRKGGPKADAPKTKQGGKSSRRERSAAGSARPKGRVGFEGSNRQKLN